MTFVLPIFALLTILGALGAWRRSPLYSLKTTLKLAGAFIAIVAMVVGVLLAVVYGPAKDSATAQAVLALIAVLVLSIGASVVIVRITDGHVAQLPGSVKLVTMHRHRVYRWLWRLAIYLLVCAGASLAVPADWFWLPTFLGGFVLLVCGPTMALLVMMARRNDRAMTAVMADPWAHWTYTPDEWEGWARDQREWERAKAGKWSWSKGLLFVGFCAALFVLGALFTGGGWRENAMIAGGLTAFIAVLMLVLYWVQRTGFDRRFRRRMALGMAERESYFGDEGVFCNGVFTPWVLSGKYLVEAEVVRDAMKDAGREPMQLVLVFQSFNGQSSTKVVQRVLVAHGGAADLAGLGRKLRAKVPTAAVRLEV